MHTVTVSPKFQVVIPRPVRESGENAALQAAAAMQRGHVLDLTPKLAVSAASLSLKHSMPMADSIILASAVECNATIWTQDIDFKGLENVKYFPKKKRPAR